VNAKLLHDSDGRRVWALVFDKGDEAVAGLEAFARQERVHAAHFTAIGAFSEATLGYFDRGRSDYDRIPVSEQVEVLSLVGDIALQDGEPTVHAHAVLGRRDGTTIGGHLFEGRVWPTLELFLSAEPAALEKREDEETGLFLIDAS
jgi:predicted DNA-binding protein with PD1-like motif